MVRVLCFLALLSFAPLAVSARGNAPQIVTEGDVLRLEADGGVVVQDEDGDTNLRDLIPRQEVEDLLEAMREEFDAKLAAIRKGQDTTVAALSDKIFAESAKETKAFDKKVQDVADGVTALQSTKATVEDLVVDVNYLIAHSENVTQCHGESELHAGDGKCVAAVPTCAPLKAIADGDIVVSGLEIIPGTTAVYSCKSTDLYLSGKDTRTCLRTKQWSGAAPVCKKCAVQDCAECTPEGKCKDCLPDFSLDEQGTCKGRDRIYMLGGEQAGMQQGYASWEVLGPKDKWQIQVPPLPNHVVYASAGMIKGKIYMVGGVTSTISRYPQPVQQYVFYQKGASKWQDFAKLTDAPLRGAFHAVVDDAFYVFGERAAGVYSPAKGAWQNLTPLKGSPIMGDRKFGATAVVGKKIYCIGGNTATGKMDVFDTATQAWDTPLPGPYAAYPERKGRGDTWHVGAAAVNGKIYVFGGYSAPPGSAWYPRAYVKEYDISSQTWSDKVAMSTALYKFSSGPLPVIGGKVYIPSANFRATSSFMTQIYDPSDDSWADGPAVALIRGGYAGFAGAEL